MHKVKNVLLILLAVVLLATGGLLPMGAAYLQDKTTAGVVQYENIAALQLKLEEQGPEMSLHEKIYLMRNGTSTEVTSQMTRMTDAEALKAMYAALQPFVEMGLLVDYLSSDALEYYPLMVYDENDPSVINCYWYMYMSLDASRYDYFSVILDDETGKLLVIEVLDSDISIGAPGLTELVDAIAAIYFSELGIDPVSAMEIDVEAVEKDADAEKNRVTIRYQCVDTLYGEINIDVCVHTNGFYIFPL